MSAEKPTSYGGIEVDPRVQWAMDVMDQEGQDFEPVHFKMLIPCMAAVTPAFTQALFNYSQKLPIKTNMIACVAAAPIAFYVGLLGKRWREMVQAENHALSRHYILTHPERFPEPKTVKYGDAIMAWKPFRP